MAKRPSKRRVSSSPLLRTTAAKGSTWKPSSSPATAPPPANAAARRATQRAHGPAPGWWRGRSTTSTQAVHAAAT